MDTDRRYWYSIYEWLHYWGMMIFLWEWCFRCCLTKILHLWFIFPLFLKSYWFVSSSTNYHLLTLTLTWCYQQNLHLLFIIICFTGQHIFWIFKDWRPYLSSLGCIVWQYVGIKLVENYPSIQVRSIINAAIISDTLFSRNISH